MNHIHKFTKLSELVLDVAREGYTAHNVYCYCEMCGKFFWINLYHGKERLEVEVREIYER